MYWSVYFISFVGLLILYLLYLFNLGIRRNRIGKAVSTFQIKWEKQKIVH